MNDAARRSFIRAIGIALLAGLGAFPTALLMILAVVLGRRLDSIFGTQPVFVLGLLCIVVPLSIFAMLRLALFAARVAARVNQKDYDTLSSTTRGEEDLT